MTITTEQVERIMRRHVTCDDMDPRGIPAAAREIAALFAPVEDVRDTYVERTQEHLEDRAALKAEPSNTDRSEATMTFYRTTFTIQVLSDHPLGEYHSARDIDFHLYDGDYEGKFIEKPTTSEQEQLTGKEMANALEEAGIGPWFFGLDIDGNPKEGK